MLNNFDHGSGNLQKSTKITKLLINYGRLIWISKKDLDFQPSPPHHAEYFLEILPMTIFIS